MPEGVLLTSKPLGKDQIESLEAENSDYVLAQISIAQKKSLLNKPDHYINPFICSLAAYSRISVCLLSLGRPPLIKHGPEVIDEAGSIEWLSFSSLEFDKYGISKVLKSSKTYPIDPIGYCENILSVKNQFLTDLRIEFGVEISAKTVDDLCSSIYNHTENDNNLYYLAKSFKIASGPKKINTGAHNEKNSMAIVRLAEAKYEEYSSKKNIKKQVPLTLKNYINKLSELLFYIYGLNPADLPLPGKIRDRLFSDAKIYYPNVIKDYLKLCAKTIYYGIVPDQEFQVVESPNCKIYYKLIKKYLAAFTVKKAEDRAKVSDHIFFAKDEGSLSIEILNEDEDYWSICSGKKKQVCADDVSPKLDRLL